MLRNGFDEFFAGSEAPIDGGDPDTGAASDFVLGDRGPVLFECLRGGVENPGVIAGCASLGDDPQRTGRAQRYRPENVLLLADRHVWGCYHHDAVVVLVEDALGGHDADACTDANVAVGPNAR
jgi:hypothetical protein